MAVFRYGSPILALSYVIFHQMAFSSLGVSVIRSETNGTLSDESADLLARVTTAGLVTVTYTTKATYGFCLSAYSSLYQGMNLVVLGMNQSFAGWEHYHPLVLYREINIQKFQETAKFIRWLLDMSKGDSDPVVLAMDGTDTVVLHDYKSLLEALHNANASILYAAERTFYVGWNGSRDFRAYSFLEPLFPPAKAESSTARNAARYLNGGAYIGQAKSLRKMFDVLQTPTLPFQGEIIETSGINDQALGALFFAKASQEDNAAIPSVALDHDSRAFECLHGREESSRDERGVTSSGDYTITKGEFVNVHTGMRPGLLHFNGEKNWNSIRSLVSRLSLGQGNLQTRARVASSIIWLWGPNNASAHRTTFHSLCPDFEPPGASSAMAFDVDGKQHTVH